MYTYKEQRYPNPISCPLQTEQTISFCRSPGPGSNTSGGGGVGQGGSKPYLKNKNPFGIQVKSCDMLKQLFYFLQDGIICKIPFSYFKHFCYSVRKLVA